MKEECAVADEGGGKGAVMRKLGWFIDPVAQHFYIHDIGLSGGLVSESLPG